MNMKTIQKMMGIFALSSALAFSATASSDSHAVKKAKEAVEEAKPYDWKTLAKSAEVCFRKNENTTEALEWIDKSIEIYKNPMNLEIKGDYYASANKKADALALYSEAIQIGKDQNFDFDTSKLQEKIWNLR